MNLRQSGAYFFLLGLHRCPGCLATASVHGEGLKVPLSVSSPTLLGGIPICCKHVLWGYSAGFQFLLLEMPRPQWQCSPQQQDRVHLSTLFM